MENRIKQAFPEKCFRVKGKKTYFSSPHLIRYADDFVILHEDITVVQGCQQIIADWLKSMGLELKPSKTRLTHTLNKCGDEEPGFDFLGFTIRQFPVGKHHSGKNGHGDLLGYKTLIKPSQKKLKLHTESMSRIIHAHRSASQKKLINRLNPVIRGWANYYSTVVSKEIFTKMDSLTYQQLRAWSNRRHPNKNRSWIADKYWQSIGNDNWVFADRKRGKGIQIRLKKHSETPIIRHIRVKSGRSLFDGDTTYWSTRMGKHPEVPKRVATLLKRQKGKCTHCERTFKYGDLMEVDHIIPRLKGGKDRYDNLQLLHRHCHDKKTAADLAKAKKEEEKVAKMMAKAKEIAEENSQKVNKLMARAKAIAEVNAGIEAR